MYTLISEKTHKARKRHLCDLCHLHINEGEMYKSQFCEGVYTFKMHLDCENIMDFYYTNRYDYDEGYGHHDFSGDVIEHFNTIVGHGTDGLNYKEMIQIFKQKWNDNKVIKEGFYAYK